MEFKRKYALLICVALFMQLVHARTTGVVIDMETYLPVPYTNIYTSDGGKVSGTASNSAGQFTVDFPFEILSFSHINYERKEITFKGSADTVFLKPRAVLLNEIVVSTKQPEWINRVLQKFISNKKERYRVTDKLFSYEYNTYTLNDSSGYEFNSTGNIMVPSMKNNQLYRINALENIIHYKDSLAGVDFSNMQRILYDNFINDFNRGFVKEHDFKQNHAYKNDNDNIVQLMFNSKKYDSDKGYIIMDTASCVILEAERNSGTAFNIKEHTSGSMRMIASKTKGFNYEEWVTSNYIRYVEIDGSYYPVDCKYKIYMKSSTVNKKNNEQYFVSIESELSMKDVATHIDTDNFTDIPRPYYMLLIRTKKMRLAEERLRAVPVRYVSF